MSEYENFIGIDPSLTATGIIVLNKGGAIVEEEIISTTNKNIIEQRLTKIKDRIEIIIKKYTSPIVYMEGLSNNSFGKTSSILELAGLSFFLRIFFYQNNIPYKIIEPTKLKKFVTGKGNAKKELCLLNVYKKWAISFEDNNLCDAFSLSKMAQEDSK